MCKHLNYYEYCQSLWYKEIWIHARNVSKELRYTLYFSFRCNDFPQLVFILLKLEMNEYFWPNFKHSWLFKLQCLSLKFYSNRLVVFSKLISNILLRTYWNNIFLYYPYMFVLTSFYCSMSIDWQSLLLRS